VTSCGGLPTRPHSGNGLEVGRRTTNIVCIGVMLGAMGSVLVVFIVSGLKTALETGVAMAVA
jgi:hypothetical protein